MTTPVLVGVGQVTQRTEPRPPIELMLDAVARAGGDAAAQTLLKEAGLVAVVGGAWPYADPGRQIADAFGADAATTLLTTFGGNMPQALVSESAQRIAAGQLDVAVICGGEAGYSTSQEDLAKMRQTEPAADEVYGDRLRLFRRHERDRGFRQPIIVYPLFESAIRHHRGETHDRHRTRVAELWQGFNRVAVENPYAWSRAPMTAEEIRDPSPGNRMVGWPYTKVMNANRFVDQAAALIVCSTDRAEALGVPRDRWVFPWVGTSGHDTLLFSNRDRMHAAPAIGIAGRRALELAGAGIDDIGYIDLYSCFPSVVQLTMEELGIAADRQVTMTGGLGFFGGPLNNYSMHGIASVVDALRADPGALGLVHANGGYATKHAFGVYSTAPPPAAFRYDNVQAIADRLPSRPVAEEHDGSVTIESYTVMHGRDGPETAFLTGLTADGARVLASSKDPSLIAAGLAEELIGRQARTSADGRLDVP